MLNGRLLLSFDDCLSPRSFPLAPTRNTTPRENSYPPLHRTTHPHVLSLQHRPPFPTPTAHTIVSLVDEDKFMNYVDYGCLCWKKVLSLIDYYYKMNPVLAKNDTLTSKFYTLYLNQLYYDFLRFECQRSMTTSIKIALEGGEGGRPPKDENQPQ